MLHIDFMLSWLNHRLLSFNCNKNNIFPQVFVMSFCEKSLQNGISKNKILVEWLDYLLLSSALAVFLMKSCF